MNYLALSGLLIFVSSVFSVLLILFKARKDTASITWILFSLFVALWGLGLFKGFRTEEYQQALFWGRFLNLAAIFIPVFFLHFTFAFAGKARARKKELSIYYAVISLYFLICFLFPKLFVSNVVPKGGFNFYPSPGLMYYPFPIIFSVFVIYGIIILIKDFVSANPARRNQIKYLLSGITIGFMGGSTTFFFVFGIPIPPVGTFLSTVYVITVSIAIGRYRLWDITFAIGKGVAYIVSLMLVCFGMWFLTTIANIIYKDIFNAKACLLIQAFTVIIYTACIILYPRFLNKLESAVENVIHRGKYKYQREIGKFIERMALIPEEEELFKQSISTLTDSLGVRTAGIFVLDQGTGCYILKTQSGMEEKKGYKFGRESKLLQWFMKSKDLLIIEEMENVVSTEDVNLIKKEIEIVEAAACIPVFLKDEILGIIIAGKKPNNEMYTHLDVELLKRFGNQFAIALNYKRIEAKLREEQNLANIGIMSMEISHEMRNLLQSPQTFIDLVPDRKDDADFMTNFRKMALDRMKVVSDKLFDIMYFGKDRPSTLKPGVDINAMLDENIMANDYSIEKDKIQIIKEYGDIPKITADKSQLTHIFNNLIINAVDAMSGKEGKIRIRTKINNEIITEMKQISDKWIRVEIKDDGEGIPDDVLAKLFTPFVTTKSMGGLKRRGTGLGLAVVKKAVNAHHGQIYIHSKKDKGTTMIVDLPVTQTINPLNTGTGTKEPWQYK